MGVFGRGPLWPDSSGTPTDPTESFVASSYLAQIGLEEALQCRVIVAGDAARAVELRLEAYLDPSETWVEVGRHVILGASIGVHPVTVRVPEVSTVRMSVRRWGGSANTTVVVEAEARGMVPTLDRNGQPLELASHQADGIECWSDGSGSSASVPAGPGAHAPSPAAAADQLWVPVGCADTLVIEAEVGGAGDDWIELQVRESPDDTTTTLEAVAVDSVVDGAVDTEVASEQISGAVGTWRTREIAVRPGTALLVLAQRAGIKAATLLAHARLYRLGRGGSGSGGPGGGEVTVTSAPETDVDVVSVGGDSVPTTETTGAMPVEDVDCGAATPVSAFDDGASGARSISDGSWTSTSGTQWHSSGRYNLLTVYIDMNVDGAETVLQARILSRVSSTVSQARQPLATNNVIDGVEDVDLHVLELPLEDNNYTYYFPCEPDREYSVDFYQEDGAATEAQAFFSFSR